MSRSSLWRHELQGREKGLECVLNSPEWNTPPQTAYPKLTYCSKAICFLELRSVTLIILVQRLYRSVMFL